MGGNEGTAGRPAEESNGGRSGNKSIPPSVITLDTNGKSEDNGPSDSEKGFGQARTPKHANKTRDEDATLDQQKITPDRGEPKPEEPHHYGQRQSYGSFPPPRPYEGRPLGGNGAFQPHEPRRQPPPPGGHPDHGYYGRPPMQVSPGGGANSDYHRRYYPNGPVRNPPPRMEGAYPPPHAPPPHHHGNYYERGYSEYGPGRPPAGYDGPGPTAYRGQYPPPPQNPPYPPQSYGAYPPERANPSWGPPPPPPQPPGGQYPPSHGGQYGAPRPPPEHYQRPPPSGPEGRYPPEHHEASGSFSRAVSSSFDRSVKSRTVDEKPRPVEAPKPAKPMSPPAPVDTTLDASMASDDLSWKMLKQVHSVDDSAIRERLKDVKEQAEENHIQVEREPASTSSSLTNSPTEGSHRHQEAKKAAETVSAAAAAAVAAAQQKQQPSSLDSLSSVASAQAPMDTSKKPKTPTPTDAPPPPSPGSESASLDLMKCSSGSSGLLHLPPHQRNLLSDSATFDGKRARDEERGDVNTGEAEAAPGEIRRAPSDFEAKANPEGQPPNKKVRLHPSSKESGEDKVKASPLSITCSPSARSPQPQAKDSKTKTSRPSSKAESHNSPHPMEGSYFDKPPSYSYSMDSAPSFPREAAGHRKQPSYPSLPPRPGSSASSTITPGQMQIDGREGHDPAVPSIPSWEIHAQDSFGAGSVGGGHGLSNSFSFQDYPMLSGSESNLGAQTDGGSTGNPPGHSAPPPPHHHPHHTPRDQPPLESRNQSFEGGHYHGGSSFHRSDSMDVSYGGRSGHPPYHEGYKHGHSGPFPPHAPSWGTAASDRSHPSAYQGGHPPGPYGSHYGSRMGGEYHQGGVMRNYSQDSVQRASPPPGPPGSHPHMHHGPRPPAGFQPPPEFAAPHNPHLNRRPPPAVYIMSSSQGGQHQQASKRGTGVFSWTKDDDMRLTEIMKKYKNPRDWEPIAKEHGLGKTAKECHERWIRYLKPGVRKGQWTDHEDAIVIEAVTTSSEQPFTRWSDLAQQLPGRVGKQIRDRWVNHLNPNINHLPFSREDDLMLWDGHKKLGKRWVEIATKLFNSTRSENHIKNRWYSASFKKFIANEFGPDAYSGGNKEAKNKEDGGASKSKKKVKAEEEDPAMQAAV